MRIHPAVVAQAAATSSVLLDGRFILGLGTGEALNESILGDVWPEFDIRMEMLEESVDLIRRLWKGDVVSWRGTHYQVSNARIYTLPAQPPPIYLSAFGPKAVDAIAEIADGYIGTAPDAELVGAFKEKSGGKPAQVGCKVSWADTKDEGVDEAHRLWANAGRPGHRGEHATAAGLRRRGLRRDLRRPHGLQLRGHDRGVRRRRTAGDEERLREGTARCLSRNPEDRSWSPAW